MTRFATVYNTRGSRIMHLASQTVDADGVGSALSFSTLCEKRYRYIRETMLHARDVPMTGSGWVMCSQCADATIPAWNEWEKPAPVQDPGMFTGECNEHGGEKWLDAATAVVNHSGVLTLTAAERHLADLVDCGALTHTEYLTAVDRLLDGCDAAAALAGALHDAPYWGRVARTIVTGRTEPGAPTSAAAYREATDLIMQGQLADEWGATHVYVPTYGPVRKSIPVLPAGLIELAAGARVCWDVVAASHAADARERRA